VYENPKSLTQNHYVTYGNNVEHFKLLVWYPNMFRLL